GRADLGRSVSGRAAVLVTDVRRARAPAAGADRPSADRPPRARGRAPPHAVPRRPRDGAPCRRPADVPRLRAALARPPVRGRGRAGAAGGPRADQPDLALGPVPRRAGDERGAARLVPRLADRGLAARARL